MKLKGWGVEGEARPTAIAPNKKKKKALGCFPQDAHQGHCRQQEGEHTHERKAGSLCVEHSPSHPRYSTEITRRLWVAGRKMEVIVFVTLKRHWEITGQVCSPDCTPQTLLCPSLLFLLSSPSSTAQLKAASKAKMQSITKHNSFLNEKAEKDSSLGQNMNHQKTTLAEIPIKGNVNNHPKPPAHSDTLVLMCRPAVLG